MAGYRAFRQRRRARLEQSARPAAGPYPILPGNREAVVLFMNLQTQWRYVGEPPCAAGLDYAAVAGVMDMLAVKQKRRPTLLARLRILEAEAVRVKQLRLRREMERRQRDQAREQRRKSRGGQKGRSR